MAAAMTGAAKEAGVQTSALAGVGVGSPGDVDEAKRHRGQRPQPPQLDGALRRSATRCPGALGTKVYVGNDVQVATDAEFKLGAGRPYRR